MRLTVDVSPDQVQHAVEHALSDLSESVKIPGFRKGKIPKPVLVSRLGKERIYAEAVDSHIGGWFWTAATRSRVRPVSDPAYEFELPDTADEAWSFIATVEVQALPELVDWTTLEVARAEIEVPQDAVDAEVEALRESVAELAPAGDRPAKAGDTPSSISSTPTRGPADTSSSWGRAALTELGRRSSARRRVSEADRVPARGRVELDRRVTVREVQEKVLPELDDELARSASEFDTRRVARKHRGDASGQLDAEIEAAFRITAVDELVARRRQPALPLVRTRAADLLTGFARSLERAVHLAGHTSRRAGEQAGARAPDGAPRRRLLRASSPSRRLPRRRG